jgi:hypothetical protein
LPDSLLRAGAREARRAGKENVAGAFAPTIGPASLLFPRGNSDWRFVCSLSRRAAAAGNMGFRGVDSIVHISVVPASEKGKEHRAEMCVTLGRSSFGEEFLTFNLLLWSHDPVVTNTGLDSTGNLGVSVFRSQPDGWYAPLDDFSKQAPTCSQMGAGIACPDGERLWIPVCCAAARFAVELRVCRTPSRQDALSSGMSSVI